MFEVRAEEGYGARWAAGATVAGPSEASSIPRWRSAMRLATGTDPSKGTPAVCTTIESTNICVCVLSWAGEGPALRPLV